MGEFETYDLRFQNRLEELHDALVANGRTGDAATIVEDECRLFLKQAIKFTPPKTRAQGEQAVSDDLRRVITPVNDSFAQYISSSFGTDEVRQWLSNKKGEHYQVQFAKVDVHGYGLPTYHASRRNARGRTIGAPEQGKQGDKWSAHYVTSYSAFTEYMKKIQSRVGSMKSGWLRSYYEVGGKLPNWIQRQANRNLGRVVNNLAIPGNPSITVTNSARGITQYERIMRDAFRARTQAMGKRIRLIVSGYSKDVASGIRVSKKATRTAGSEVAE